MVKAIRVHEAGGPEVLRFEDYDPGAPGKGEVLVEHKAVGLNFLDVYFRTGLYPAPLPLVPGSEAAGVVVETGEGVDSLKPGDRVAYCLRTGSYCERRVVPADRLVKVPDGITDEQAAAMMLKGMTAWYLLHRTFQVKSGHTILFHAAAGGVGLIAGQWAKHIGARTIGTVGSGEKGKLAKAHGYDHVINYRDNNFVDEVKKITDGALCEVVYDSVGKDTFPGSLDCLKKRGMFVSFGQSSGPMPPVNLAILSQKGSLFATRPTLFDYIAKREDLEAASSALFDVVRSGVVEIVVNQKYALKDAAKAHADLEGRRTTGTTVLIP
ncbi:NADPH2:quinone reductase [Mesorhizobium sp. J18]|uniref:quinone oxidoreductase family protein n=1 Tax=Mesorhizobium sp. J18 TaxID=935263 RepID=UPI0011993D23|nr:quinone oxidoreductase [Mesorhizobium sp. J18]TWG94178.1 NADPH2:quinone reductase [Mesorhizobium sp. J18]